MERLSETGKIIAPPLGSLCWGSPVLSANAAVGTVTGSSSPGGAVPGHCRPRPAESTAAPRQPAARFSFIVSDLGTLQ